MDGVDKSKALFTEELKRLWARVADPEQDAAGKVHPDGARLSPVGPGDKLDIPDETLAKWQTIVDLAARIIRVPVALIMRVDLPYLEVLISSVTEGNPYQQGQRAELNTGLYCEKVMAQRSVLRVPDARQDSQWERNPDLERGMIAYLGFPLLWPAGEMFGTICVLDNKENQYSDVHERLLSGFKQIIEKDLRSLLRDTAERNRSDAVLRAGETKYRTLVNNIPAVIWTTDRDGKAVFISPKVESVCGHTQGEIYRSGSDAWWAAIHPDDLERVKEAYQLLFEKMAAFDVEYRIRHKDGRWIWIHDRSTATYEIDGAMYADGMFSDISDRKRAEEALRKARAELEMRVQERTAELQKEISDRKRAEYGLARMFAEHKAVVDAVPDLLFKLDLSGNLVWWTKRVEEVTGLSPQVLKNRPALEFVDEQDRSAVGDAIANALARGEAEVEARLITQTGLTWYHFKGVASSDKSGAPIGITAAGRDVSDRRRAEEALQDSHEYFRSLDRISSVLSQKASSIEVLRALVREILDMFDVDRAWLLHPCDPQAPSWQVPVEAARPEYPGASEEGAETPMVPSAASVLRDALENPGPVTCQFPEGSERPDWARDFHIQSQMDIVLRPTVGQPWLLGMHQCSRQREWTDYDKRIFGAIAERVTDALTNHLLREKLEEDIGRRVEAEARTQELLQQNRGLTQRLFQIQEEERRHIARELHDEFGQWLTAMQLHAQVIANLTESQAPAIRDSAKAITESIGKIYKDMRGMIGRLRPSVLDTLGLTESLQELVDQWQERHPEIHCELVLEGDLADLGELTNISVYRIVQEGLTNIAKHAQASHVSVRLQRDRTGGRFPGPLVLTIEDDGKGADMSAPRGGVGLLGMRERALAAGGEFALSWQGGRGLRIEVRFPIDQHKE